MTEGDKSAVIIYVWGR